MGNNIPTIALKCIVLPRQVHNVINKKRILFHPPNINNVDDH